jgi:hypothetical protein
VTCQFFFGPRPLSPKIHRPDAARHPFPTTTRAQHTHRSPRFPSLLCRHIPSPWLGPCRDRCHVTSVVQGTSNRIMPWTFCTKKIIRFPRRHPPQSANATPHTQLPAVTPLIPPPRPLNPSSSPFGARLGRRPHLTLTRRRGATTPLRRASPRPKLTMGATTPRCCQGTPPRLPIRCTRSSRRRSSSHLTPYRSSRHHNNRYLIPY